MGDQLTYISLFSGAGGGDIGLDAAGYRCVAQVEIDDACQKVLRRHWPTVPKWGDITTVSGHMLPAADVVAFGSPCQDLSIANNQRAGLAGSRSSLFYEAVRIINELRDATNLRLPRAVIWENVPGALSSNRGEDYRHVLHALAGCGAHLIEWCVVDARHWVPQRRRRVFVVAILDAAVAARCGEQILPIGPRCSRHPRSSDSTRQDTAGALTRGLGTGGADSAHGHAGWLIPDDVATYRMSALGTYVQDDTASAMKARDHKDATDLVATSEQTQVYVKRGRAQTVDDAESWAEGDTSPTLNAFDNGGDARATVLAIDNAEPLTFAMYPDSNGGEAPGALRITTLDAAPTIAASDGAKTSDTGLRIGYQASVRRLTPLECERLQGWPDHHTAFGDDDQPIADSRRYRMAGNGIAAPAMQWVAHHLAQVLAEP